MSNDLILGGVYILMAVMLVLGVLMTRREPAAKKLTFALVWILIFASGFVLLTFRDDFGWVAQRLHAEATGAPVEQGAEIRIPMAIDGHFWIHGRINGEPVKFLVDSGATMTTIGQQTAQRTSVSVSPTPNQMVRTGNGIIKMSTGRAGSLQVGTIERTDFGMHVAAGDELNVLGMNFLSSLRRWGVEGRWLVLVS